MKLRKVFDPTKRPWVNMNGAGTQDIIDIVEECPTDALTWKWNRNLTLAEEEELKKEPAGEEMVPTEVIEIKIMENGPALVKGNFRLVKASGERIQTTGQIALCRCGHSRNKPFCDGSHHTSGFRG